MRAILITLIIFSTIPFILMRPYFGVLVYMWISLMSPHRLAWGFAYDFPFAMLIAVVTVVAWLISREPKVLPLTTVTVLMIMLTLWESVSTYFALNGPRPGPMPWHIEEWIRVMKIMSFTFLAMILLTNRSRIDWYIWVMVVSIGYYAVKGGLFTIVSGGHYRVWGPMNSMIQENNALAVATIMIVPLARYLHLQATNKHVRRCLLASIPIMTISALGSQSRGALLAVSAMAFFMFVKSRHKLAVGGATVALAIGVLSFAPQTWWDRMETIKTYDRDASALTRLNAWTTAFNLALDRPLVGGGFKAFVGLPEVWEKYAPDPNDTAVTHSIYFQMLGEHGFPGLIFFLGVLYFSFRNGRWLIKNARDRPDFHWARDLGAMIQVSLIGYAVGGAFLNLANYDLYWSIVVTAAAARVFVAKELAKPTQSPRAEAAVSSAAAVPASPRKSFLRAPGEAVGAEHFRRG